MDRIKKLVIFTAIVTYLSEKRKVKKIKEEKIYFDFWKISSRINVDEEEYYRKIFNSGFKW